MTCHEAARALDPYVDNELSPEDSAALRAHVETCAACRQALDERIALRRLIRRLPYRTAPDRVRAAVAAVPGRRRFMPALACAAALLVGLSLAAAVLSIDAARARQSAQPPAVVASAVVDAHVRALMADHLVDVPSSDQHAVKPWFLGKLDFAPPVRDLTPAGFPLIGGRLDYLAARPVAALVYRRREHTINLFIWPEVDGSQQQEEARTIRGFNIQRWTQGGMSFRAVSDLNVAELAAFAGAFRK